MSEEQETVHIELNFNQMIMTVSEREDQCHPKARFWLSWDKWPQIEMFCKMNQVEKVQDKKLFGILVANRIIQLRR